MKLRTQLVLAFFFLAVVPLAGVSIYSYNSSIRAFRQVVESESGYLADDMSQRMESVSSDLNHRIQRLGAFPFRQLMAREAKPGDPQRQDLVNQLMSQIGESAPFIRALEFTPMHGADSGIPPSAQHPRRPPPSARAPEPAAPQPDALIIRLAGDAAAQKNGAPPMTPTPDGKQMILDLRVPTPGAPPQPPLPPAAVEQLQSAAKAAVQSLAKRAEELKLSVDVKTQIGDIASMAMEVGKREIELASARNFRSEVHRQGEVVGSVRAQVSSGQILRHVLSRTQRKQGEIPFAFDTDGKIHTANPADMALLEKLPLPTPQTKPDAPAGQQSTTSDWIFVTRKDAPSGVTFGIARPIGQRLDEIRKTAGRNLAYGLGMVCLAFIGILPLSSRMTRNLTTLTHGAEQLARGDLQTRVDVRSKDEIGMLAQAFNRMAQDLAENEKHLVERERLRKELEMCRKIQEELLPRKPLKSGVVEVQGVSIPAREVGGDFFNYFAMPDGRVALLIGDVSGKGLPAALLMANLQATIRARLPLEPDLAKLAGELDWEIQSGTPQEVYLTLFIAILDSDKRTLTYVNAGHNPQFVLHAGGVERLESTGRPLGLLPGAGYGAREIQFKDGDSLFFYTDGLVETANAADEEFGTDRLEKLLVDYRASGVEGFLGDVEKAAQEFRGGVEAADDATMVLVRVGDIPTPRA